MPFLICVWWFAIPPLSSIVSILPRVIKRVYKVRLRNQTPFPPANQFPSPRMNFWHSKYFSTCSQFLYCISDHNQFSPHLCNKLQLVSRSLCLLSLLQSSISPHTIRINFSKTNICLISLVKNPPKFLFGLQANFILLCLAYRTFLVLDPANCSISSLVTPH